MTPSIWTSRGRVICLWEGTAEVNYLRTNRSNGNLHFCADVRWPASLGKQANTCPCLSNATKGIHDRKSLSTQLTIGQLLCVMSTRQQPSLISRPSISLVGLEPASAPSHAKILTMIEREFSSCKALPLSVSTNNDCTYAQPELIRHLGDHQ
jgi:hypothetical protein